MAVVLTLRETPGGGGTLVDSADASKQVASYGVDPIPQLTFALTNGTGSQQANNWHLSTHTVTATSFELLDLAGGLTNYRGSTLTFTKIKRVLIAINDPDGTKTLRVGPQNQSNAVPLWFGGVATSNYDTMTFKLDNLEPYSGWVVTAGSADVLPVYNPTTGTITYTLWVVGVT